MPTVQALEAKREKRVRKRKHHYSALKRFQKAGKHGKAAWHLARFRSQVKAIRKLDRLITKAKVRQEAARRNAYVNGPWGGSKAVAREIEQIVTRHRGNVTGSQKRTETYGNPGSDHHVSQTTAYAIDFYLTDDSEMAGIIYAKLTGNPASSWGGDYSDFYIERYGINFRVQLIAGTHGTGPHLHAGVRRV